MRSLLNALKRLLASRRAEVRIEAQAMVVPPGGTLVLWLPRVIRQEDREMLKATLESDAAAKGIKVLVLEDATWRATYVSGACE